MVLMVSHHGWSKYNRHLVCFYRLIGLDHFYTAMLLLTPDEPV